VADHEVNFGEFNFMICPYTFIIPTMDHYYDSKFHADFFDGNCANATIQNVEALSWVCIKQCYKWEDLYGWLQINLQKLPL